MNILKRIMYVIIIMLAIVFICTNITNATTVEVITETLNLREEASTDSDIVALISQGEECQVLKEEGDWYQVQYGDYTGYISKEYVKVISEIVDGNSIDTNENNTNEEGLNNTVNNNNTNNENKNNTNNQSNEKTNNAIKKGKINKKVNVKIVPLINGSKIETLKSGTEITIINQINGWSYIQTDYISGWIRTETIVEVNNNSNNQKTDNSDNKNDNEETEIIEFEEKTMYTNDSYVNIREQANTNSKIIMVVEQNTQLKVVGENGDWYEVETSQGNAYVSKDLLSDKQTTITNRGNITRTKDKIKEEEAEVINTSTSNSSKGKKIVDYAKKYLGVPYVYGGASSSGFDCSGFTMYVYEHFGISMPHGAQSQSRMGEKISADKDSRNSLIKNLEMGDLVFFLDYETMDEIGHCGIYIGNGEFIHASSGSGYCVKINSLLPGEPYNTRYCAARRIL